MSRLPAEDRLGTVGIDESAIWLIIEFPSPSPRHVRKLRCHELDSWPPIRDVGRTQQQPNVALDLAQHCGRNRVGEVVLMQMHAQVPMTALRLFRSDHRTFVIRIAEYRNRP